ncbi:hypothetical protein CGRA01v4_14519 [Colletotrichum graminicola]|uniref:Uncharacterized protein n=1 Tax=Colletotrichum graminicola (strain M1.001 / M2 / FGSC 10212) TaxID=645133 RepID=E3Q4Q9_COLGM|nr:uncharacterized protein GLRG_01218 [Colletotrichum graminicola M1.001]EFQ26074.1 hypothetical protein GLRG_01218 [Colletotrichum graminicola M1.001]WDK23227.1 hypothetical protein CGRA01v4_14519 [Colletotrichum graminicola]
MMPAKPRPPIDAWGSQRLYTCASKAQEAAQAMARWVLGIGLLLIAQEQKFEHCKNIAHVGWVAVGRVLKGGVARRTSRPPPRCVKEQVRGVGALTGTGSGDCKASRGGHGGAGSSDDKKSSR